MYTGQITGKVNILPHSQHRAQLFFEVLSLTCKNRAPDRQLPSSLLWLRAFIPFDLVSFLCKTLTFELLYAFMYMHHVCAMPVEARRAYQIS